MSATADPLQMPARSGPSPGAAPPDPITVGRAAARAAGLLGSLRSPHSPSRAFSTTSLQRRVDVPDVAGHLVDGLAEAHALDQRLDQRRRLRADEVGAEQQAGLGVGDQLAEAGRCPPWPSRRPCRRRPAPWSRGGCRRPPRPARAGPTDGDLGMAEHGVGHERAVDAPQPGARGRPLAAARPARPASMLSNATRASALARCLSCIEVGEVAEAHTPGTLVAIVSSLSTRLPAMSVSRPPTSARELVAVGRAARGHQQHVA